MTFQEILDKLQETHRQTKWRSIISSAFPARFSGCLRNPCLPAILLSPTLPCSCWSRWPQCPLRAVCGLERQLWYVAPGTSSCLCLSLYFIVRDTPTGDLSPRKCSWGWLGAALERFRCLLWRVAGSSRPHWSSSPRTLRPCARPALGHSPPPAGHIPARVSPCWASSFPTSRGAAAVSARYDSVFVFCVGKTDFGRQVVHKITSLRVPKGSSGNWLLPSQCRSPRLGAVMGRVAPMCPAS